MFKNVLVERGDFHEIRLIFYLINVVHVDRKYTFFYGSQLLSITLQNSLVMYCICVEYFIARSHLNLFFFILVRF